MEAIAAITGRRSIRRGFTDREVPPEVVSEVVRCGLHAPSSKDDQPWRLTALLDRRLLQGIGRRMAASERADRYVPVDPADGAAHPGLASSVVESARVLGEVPLAIAIENIGSFTGGRERISGAGLAPSSLSEALIGYGFEYLGLGAALQSMWLAAQAHGLSGVFVGDVLIVEEEVRELVGLQGELVGLLALGYSASPPHADRYLKPGRSRTIRGGWTTPR